jgi:hypothetical protein
VLLENSVVLERLLAVDALDAVKKKKTSEREASGRVSNCS